MTSIRRPFGHEYFPWLDGTTLHPPEAARRRSLWERAIELRAAATPAYRATFIHRDFHPGNVLWLRGRCSGVVDWANACRGPAGCDVATCRANLIDLAGSRVADEFLAAYEATIGETHQPYWELASVLEAGASHWTAENVVEAELRLERAIEAMG